MNGHVTKMLEVHRTKRLFDSSVLGRAAHIDEFCVGASAAPLILLFGGSGIDEIEYQTRAQTLTSVLDQLLSWLAASGYSCRVTHVTAPYDIPIRKLYRDTVAAELWTRHILQEVVPAGVVDRFVVAGFSGGAILALTGVDRSERCVGGAVFGADGVSQQWRRPSHWTDPLEWYVAKGDLVGRAAENQAVSRALATRGDGRLHSVPY